MHIDKHNMKYFTLVVNQHALEKSYVYFKTNEIRQVKQNLNLISQDSEYNVAVVWTTFMIILSLFLKLISSSHLHFLTYGKTKQTEFYILGELFL